MPSVLNTNWKSEYETGIPEIDIQHIKFLSLIHELEEKGTKEFSLFHEKIYKYARFHFASEESLMLIYGYEPLLSHHQEHERILMKLMEFKPSGEISEKEFGSFLIFLVNWFAGHTSGRDKDLGLYINKNS